jgi:alcohol dehydrogenase YqhD (iron-dependent ADH family)
MERYYTREPHVDLTDRLCEAVMKAVIDNAPRVLANPRDYDARAEIMLAGSVAHNDSLDVGRVGDWASHMIEHELSAFNDVAHGAGLAVLVPNWMKYVYRQDVARFAQFAVRVFNVEEHFHELEETALRGIAALRNFFNSLGMPATLKEIGVEEKAFQAIAEKVKKFDPGRGTVGHFYPLTVKDIVEILKLAA